MLFKKKRGMIDVRELQKRGVVVIPKEEIVIPTDKEGFVDLRQDSKTKTQKTSNDTTASFFGFGSGSSMESPSTFSSQTDGYNKREVDAKMVDLDNKVYKLEQRIELLEKKVGVNQPVSSDGGIIGW